jgi:hypothetical protein
MFKAFVGLSLGTNIVLLLAAFSLAKDTPESGQLCVPLYSQTGLECIEKGCK